MVQKEFELVTWGAINALYQLRIPDSVNKISDPKNSADDEIDDGVQNPWGLTEMQNPSNTYH